MRCDELANLLEYERTKTKTSEQIIQELEEVKLRSKTYQEKAQQIPDLNCKID